MKNFPTCLGFNLKSQNNYICHSGLCYEDTHANSEWNLETKEKEAIEH